MTELSLICHIIFFSKSQKIGVKYVGLDLILEDPICNMGSNLISFGDAIFRPDRGLIRFLCETILLTIPNT